MISKAQGCLVGLCVGDALGSQYEFMSAKAISYIDDSDLCLMTGSELLQSRPGQITDDGEMALCLVNSLLHNKRFSQSSVKSSYVNWARSNPIDIGGTTANALLLNKFTPGSESNGALMRIAPLGIYGANHFNTLLLDSIADAAITHCNKKVFDCSYMFSCAIALMISNPEYSKETILDLVGHYARTHNSFTGLFNDIDTLPDDYYTNMGHVDIAFRNAFYHLKRGSSYEDAIVDTIKRGGDTDTNAAIVGALLGTYHGIGSIPKYWVNSVIDCVTTRPQEYSTKNILVQAENLLTLP